MANTREDRDMTETRPPLMPQDTPDYMAPAWASCLMWAAGEPQIVAAFRKDTQCTYIPPRNKIEEMIDDACGSVELLGNQFAEWFNANIWATILKAERPERRAA